jgi:hypothetical protein
LISGQKSWPVASERISEFTLKKLQDNFFEQNIKNSFKQILNKWGYQQGKRGSMRENAVLKTLQFP